MICVQTWFRCRLHCWWLLVCITDVDSFCLKQLGGNTYCLHPACCHSALGRPPTVMSAERHARWPASRSCITQVRRRLLRFHLHLHLATSRRGWRQLLGLPRRSCRNVAGVQPHLYTPQCPPRRQGSRHMRLCQVRRVRCYPIMFRHASGGPFGLAADSDWRQGGVG